MRAIRIHNFGGPEVLVLDEVPQPKPGPGEVLIQTAVAGVNRRDVWIRQGRADTRVALPLIPGMDVAGTVVDVGSGVPTDRVGNRVVVAPGIGCGACLRCRQGDEHLCDHYRSVGNGPAGGYAEYVVVPTANALLVPDSLSLELAGSMPVIYTTAWRLLVRLGGVRAGETVLVHAVGSGAGHAAFQVARLHGARVIVTAGDDWKLERAVSEGAFAGINYRTHDFVDEVRRLTDGAGVDIVVEHIGGEIFTRSLDVLSRGGRILSFGATTGGQVALDLLTLQKRRAQVLASAMGSSSDLLAAIQAATQGGLHPALAARLPLQDAPEAHRMLESRQVYGKVVLVP